MNTGIEMQLKHGIAEAGTWRRVLKQDGSMTAVVCCPVCGWNAEIECGIADNGLVTKRYDCPDESCDFSAHLTLVNWTPF